ncbi:fungal transcriptional regulatory protein [Scheffersomyces amazonensis]|uniref:fungal transcriptional regulatory protein n=1 Tax=Scheffersomyces amazonensis TaxID=1078765 RepID=UPI00315DA639
MQVRYVTVCENCRLRKVKCDRKLPCSSCKRTSIDCKYKTSAKRLLDNNNTHDPTVVSDIGSDEFRFPKKIHISTVSPTDEEYNGNEYKSDDIDTINVCQEFHHVYVKPNTVRCSYGPFTWVSFMKSDKTLRHIWNYIDFLGISNLFKAMEGVDQESLNNYNCLDHQYLTGIVLSINPLSIVPQDPETSESYLISILPSRKVVWTLIRRFFKIVYPYVPIVDERDFRAHITRILDEESFEEIKFETINVDNKLDFAHLGTLLIILRLSYLSYLSMNLKLNDTSNISNHDSKSLERKFILNNPISLQLVSLAKEYLNEFDMFERTSIYVFQLALFLRTYKHFAPDEGDTPDGCYVQVLTSTLVSIANNLGINRECSHDVTERGLFRKMFIHLNGLDSFESLTFGTPTSINYRFIENKFAKFDPLTSNLVDIRLEQEIISAYDNLVEVHDLLTEIYTLTINLNVPVSIEVLGTKIKALEKRLVAEGLRIGSDSLKDSFEVRQSLLGFQVLLTIYSILFVHYDSKGQYSQSFSYIYNAVRLIKIYIIPFLRSLHEVNDNVLVISLLPLVQSLYLKIVLVVCSLLLRNNVSLQKEAKDSDRLKSLILLSISLRNTAIEVLEILSPFGTRYYYFWRITRGCNGVLKICYSRDFYGTIKDDPSCELNFSSLEVKLLLQLFYEEALQGNEFATIDLNAVINASIPEISNDYISGIDLNKFWYIVKKGSKSTSSSTESVIETDFNHDEPFDFDYFAGFYNEFFNGLDQ